jgi:hypothetical protein
MSFEPYEKSLLSPEFGAAAVHDNAQHQFFCDGDLVRKNGQIGLTDDGMKLICLMDKEFPDRGIKNNILTSLETVPKKRVKAALKKLKLQKRRGPLRIGIHPDDVISVLAHTLDMMKFAADRKVARVHDLRRPILLIFAMRIWQRPSERRIK